MDTMDVVYPVDFEIVLKAYLTFHTHDLNQAYLLVSETVHIIYYLSLHNTVA